MEKDTQVIFLSDIKKYVRKQEYFSFVGLLVIALPIFHSVFTQANLPLKILGTACCLLILYGMILTIYHIFKLRNNTFFTIRADKLISKQENIYSFIHKKNRNRLHFQKGHYDIFPYSGLSASSTWSPIYNMDMQTLYDTAFIEDTFTLICSRKQILLAFNDSYYTIEDDL